MSFTVSVLVPGPGSGPTRGLEPKIPTTIFPSSVLRRTRVTADGGSEPVDFSRNEDAMRQTTMEGDPGEANAPRHVHRLDD